MIKKLLVPGAVGLAAVVGVAGGSMLNALAANADTTNSTHSQTASTDSSTNNQPAAGQNQGPHTANGITETVLTGDTADKAIAAAKAAEPDATVIRAETDAEGAKYEVHMKKSDGTCVTVKLDANFKVTSTEDGMGPGGSQGQRGQKDSTNNTND